MRRSSFFIALIALNSAAPALAQDPYWECARFAREFSGIEIRGDAWTWWGQAEGRYERGYSPRIGAVLSFAPYGPMRLGHVATVTRVLGDREIAVTHANWSVINGTRGQIEHDVLIRDVSQDNDWSRVRVWFAPLADLGTTAWPVDGFIYPAAESKPAVAHMHSASVQMSARTVSAPHLDYASVDAFAVGNAPQSTLRLGQDVIRLARLEDRRGR